MSSVPPNPSGDQPPGPYGAAPYGGSPYGAYQQPGTPPGGYPYQQPYQQQGYGGYGPPPKKSKAPLIVAAVAAFVVLVILMGVGGFFLLKDDDSGDRAASDSPSSSQRANDDSEDRGEDSDIGDQAGDNQFVQPEGAPFSFTVPDRMEQTAGPISDDDSQYRIEMTPVDPGRAGTGIQVAVIPDERTTDITSVRDQLTRGLEAQGVTITSTTQIDVDGKPALLFRGTYQGTQVGYGYAASSSGEIVNVGCGWYTGDEPAASIVESGCRQVLDSMTVE